MHLVAHKVGTPNIQIWDKKKGKRCLKICKIYTFHAYEIYQVLLGVSEIQKLYKK